MPFFYDMTIGVVTPRQTMKRPSYLPTCQKYHHNPRGYDDHKVLPTESGIRKCIARGIIKEQVRKEVGKHILLGETIPKNS